MGWEIWIPGAVSYLVKADHSADMVYQHGAAMNELTIGANGDFTWGEHSGTLEIVTPWYAEEGKAYFRISDIRNNTYDFWYKEETDQLVILFGEVGGHAATGSRLEPSLQATVESEEDSPQESMGTYNIGQEVQVEWSGGWYKAKILDRKEGLYKVHYSGWGDNWDEWVKPERIKEKSQE